MATDETQAVLLEAIRQGERRQVHALVAGDTGLAEARATRACPRSCVLACGVAERSSGSRPCTALGFGLESCPPACAPEAEESRKVEDGCKRN